MKQGLTQTQKLTQRQYQMLLQKLTTSPHLDQEIRQILAQNPELEVAEEPVFPEGRTTEPLGGWNPDFAESEDEWETGERGSPWLEERDDLELAAALEKAAEDQCGEDGKCLERALSAIQAFRLTGRLPDNTGRWLVQALATLQKSYSDLPPVTPLLTFQVAVRNDRVVASVTASMTERVVQAGNIRGFSSWSKLFLEQRRERLLILNTLAHHILEDLQSDFFRQSDLRLALRMLIPLPPERIQQLPISSRSKLDKHYLSRLGKLLVESSLGIFPLSLFWPASAELRRVWVRAAQEAGHTEARTICDWIRREVEQRSSPWPPSDTRHTLLHPLLTVSVQDIRNALKQM